ncbi:hypothetical protein D3C76_1644030 [compost metagenome]
MQVIPAGIVATVDNYVFIFQGFIQRAIDERLMAPETIRLTVQLGRPQQCACQLCPGAVHLHELIGMAFGEAIDTVIVALVVQLGVDTGNLYKMLHAPALSRVA